MEASWGVVAGALFLAYLAGSIPFGVWVTRWRRGVDVREHGSGNIGATNVARVAGKRLGVLVLLLDALKGGLAVAAARHCVPSAPWLHAGVGLAAFLGHVFPVWLRFRGGKGVATALGVLACLIPAAALAGVAVYGLCFAKLRVSSIGSLLGGLTALGTAFALQSPPSSIALAGTLFVLMVFTHRGNIRRILRREERKL